MFNLSELGFMILMAVFAKARAQHCSAEDRNQISNCAQNLFTAGFQGTVDYILASNHRKFMFSDLCDLFIEFHTCAEKMLSRCATTDIRFNTYLLSIEAWASLCLSSRGETYNILTCLHASRDSDKLMQCRMENQAATIKLSGSFSPNEKQICEFIDNHLACMRQALQWRCTPEVYQRLAQAYKKPASFFLKTCSVNSATSTVALSDHCCVRTVMLTVLAILLAARLLQ